MGGLDFLSGPTWFTIANLVSMEMKFRALSLKYQPTSELPGGLVKTQISGPLSQNSWCRRSGWGSENVPLWRVPRWCYWSSDHAVRCAGPNTEERSQCLGVGLSRWRGLSSRSFVSHWKPRPGVHVSEHEAPSEGSVRSPTLCYLKHTFCRVTKSRVTFQCSRSPCPVAGRNSPEQKEQVGRR